MPLIIEDFENYTNYPTGLCSGFKQGFEKENMLAFMLGKAIEAKDLNTVIDTDHTHPTMVQDGLLEEVGAKQYKLTTKSLSLIYAHQSER